jgi:peptide/nickel transport system permease protein
LIYIVRRLLTTVVSLLAVSVLVFALLHLAPGDPATVVAGPDATPQDIDAVRHRLELNDDLAVQYGRWLSRAARGDLGDSYILGRPVADLVLQRVGSTAQLVLCAMLLTLAISFPFGVLLAATRAKQGRAALRLLAAVALSIPPFVTSILLIFWLSVVWPIFPSGGSVALAEDPLSSLGFVALPALALALPNAAVLATLLGTDMRRTLAEPFVVTAHAKGLPRRRVIWRHAVRASLTAYVVHSGVVFGSMLGGALVVEAIFARAGIGDLLVQAVLTRDYPTAQALLLLTVSAAILGQFIAEMINARLQGRTRTSGQTP